MATRSSTSRQSAGRSTAAMPRLSPGDHVKVDCGYWHHGVVVGPDTIIHFSGVNAGKAQASIRLATLADFAGGREVITVQYGRRHDAETTVALAWAALGRGGYDLAQDNCEHFARYCCTGTARSLQVENAVGAAGTGMVTFAAAPAAVAGVAALGVVKGISAAGVMSGLATAGGQLGAVGGVAIVAGAPATLTATIVNNTVFRDDLHGTPDEREARAHARLAAAIGIPVAVLGSIILLARAGSPGLSAIGISSGLKAIGGSMIRGIAMLAGLGVFAVVILGFGAYLLSKWVARRRRIPAAPVGRLLSSPILE